MARSLDWTDLVQLLAALAICLPSELTSTQLAGLHWLWSDTLGEAARLERPDLLGYVGRRVPLIGRLGGINAVEQCDQAIRQVGEWWP